MDEKEFSEFLNSISNYDKNDDILLEKMKFIGEFYRNFKEKVDNDFEDKLGEFSTSFASSGERVFVNVQDKSLYFDFDSKENAIKVKYIGKEKDRLYVDPNKRVFSKATDKVLSEDLLKEYLDFFKDLKN